MSLKLLLVCGSLLITNLALAQVPDKGAKKSMATKPQLLAALKIEDENTYYRVLQRKGEKVATLERSSAKLTNKKIKIPSGLASNIKADLLNLSWQSKYESGSAGSSGCDLAARIDIEAEDSVRICKNQKSDVAHIKRIQKNLNELMASKPLTKRR